MNKFAKLLLLGLVIMSLVTGCGAGKDNTASKDSSSEEVVFNEENAVNVAKEFVLATQGDKEKIKEISFPTLVEQLEKENWSILLEDGVEINKDSVITDVEKSSETQYMVTVKYVGSVEHEGKSLEVDFSKKLGIVEYNKKPAVFSVE